LVRRLCAHCKRPTALTPEMAKIFEVNLIPVRPDQNFLYVPAGCPECGEMGYRGRIALMEMCAMSTELADMISQNAPQSQMRAVAHKAGVLSLYQEGLLQVLAGQTTFEEVACLAYTALSDDDEEEKA